MLTPRQTNLLLEALIVTSLITGIASWMVGLSWARPFTAIHAVSGVSLLLVAPLKIRGSVRTGLRRRRASRWVSLLFGAMVLGAIVLGLLHATGAWFGVGYWTALWTHLLLGFALVPLLVWHVWSRPVRPSVVDVNRRALLRVGMLSGAAAGVVAMQELAVRLGGLAGAERAGTGSHEIGSFDPERMPVVSWLDDRVPDLDPGDWLLVIGGQPATVDAISAAARPLVATLDCTGGWRSDQSWDVVPLATLVPDGPGRSIRVVSATGYSRLFGNDDEVYVATGYGGAPLRRGHGAPIRIVAPGRRGPWWVKWVTAIERSDRPPWLQLPFPPT